MKMENKNMNGVDVEIEFNYPDVKVKSFCTKSIFVGVGIVTGIISLVIIAAILCAGFNNAQLGWPIVLLSIVAIVVLLLLNHMVYSVIKQYTEYEIGEAKALAASKRKLIETAINHEIALQKEAISSKSKK